MLILQDYKFSILFVSKCCYCCLMKENVLTSTSLNSHAKYSRSRDKWRRWNVIPSGSALKCFILNRLGKNETKILLKIAKIGQLWKMVKKKKLYERNLLGASGAFFFFLEESSFLGFGRLKTTSSRSSEKCGSWEHIPSMIWKTNQCILHQK